MNSHQKIAKMIEQRLANPKLRPCNRQKLEKALEREQELKAVAEETTRYRKFVW